MPRLEPTPIASKANVSRRRALVCLTSGIVLGAGECSKHGWLAPVEAVIAVPEELVREPVKVPHDFVGMHAHRWPAGSPASAPPSYAFGAARSHDHDGVSWNLVHKGPGSYAWEALDRWVAVHAAAGRTMIYTLYGTPAWLAQPNEAVDLYGRPGGASPPRDLLPLGDFVAALLHRYNGEGQRRIRFVETWNEPHFDGSSRDFWRGTADQLVAVGRTVHTAAKAIDPGVRVLSPGFVGDLTGALSLSLPLLASARRSSLYQYLTASDGHGGVGSKWCDGIAFHTYNAPAQGENAGYILGIRKLQTMLGLMQIKLPLYNTECGFIRPDPFHQLTPADQATQLKRLAVIQAALGVQGLFFYSHDDDLVGNPSKHPEIARAIHELHNVLAGKMLHQVTLSPDGATRVVTDAGAFAW